MSVKTCTLSRRQSRLFGAGEVRIRRKCAGLSAGLSDIDLTDEKNQKWLLGFSDTNPFGAPAAGALLDVKYDGMYHSATVKEIWIEADDVRGGLWTVVVLVPTPYTVDWTGQ